MKILGKYQYLYQSVLSNFLEWTIRNANIPLHLQLFNIKETLFNFFYFSLLQWSHIILVFCKILCTFSCSCVPLLFKAIHYAWWVRCKGYYELLSMNYFMLHNCVQLHNIIIQLICIYYTIMHCYSDPALQSTGCY